jgi:endonuclease-3
MPKTALRGLGRKREWVPSLIEKLEREHGRVRIAARFDPMEELISCILSQHTSDANSFPAFGRLRQRYPDWHAVASCPPEELADTIRQAGLANQKAKSIQATLKAVQERVGAYHLEPLRELPLSEATEWLLELPGVGPKTAAIVLSFSFQKGAIPVDTHVYRVSQRLELLPGNVDANQAHEVLPRVVPPEYAFRYHTALIRHGRATCKAPLPLCHRCALIQECPWYRKVGPEQERRRLKRKRTASG